MASSAHAQWTDDAPAPADLTRTIAQAIFDKLETYLTPVGRKNFWKDVSDAKTVHEVLEAVDVWMMTLQFLQSPDAAARMARADQARKQRVKGESTKALFARLGI